MKINKFNHEGYHDPTAYEALKNIPANDIKESSWPIVFICSAYKDDVEYNKLKTIRYSRFELTKNKIPIAPHLIFTNFLNEDDNEDRILGLSMGLKLLTKCYELWCFGKISEGMKNEIEKARKLEIKIRFFTDSCKEVLD